MSKMGLSMVQMVESKDEGHVESHHLLGRLLRVDHDGEVVGTGQRDSYPGQHQLAVRKCCHDDTHGSSQLQKENHALRSPQVGERFIV